MVEWLKKLKKYFHREILKDIEKNIEKESSSELEEFFSQLSKFTILVDLFVEKEVALDKFLTDLDKESEKNLLNTLHKIKETMEKEWKDTDDFLRKVNELTEAQHAFTRKAFHPKTGYSKAIVEIRAYLLKVTPLLEKLKIVFINQFNLISDKNNLLENKEKMIQLIENIIEEGKILRNIFGLEFTYLKEFEKIQEMTIPSLQERLNENKSAVEKDDENAIARFIHQCIQFILQKRIDTVIVTEDSAHILGILLSNQLKKQNIKNIPVVGFNPRVLESQPLEQRKTAIIDNEQVSFGDIKNSFIKERRALMKNNIVGKNLLIIDEYTNTGKTILRTKAFFKDLGAENVYTATCFKDENTRISGRKIDFYAKVVARTPELIYGLKMGKKKEITKEKIRSLSESIPPEMLRTRTSSLLSKYKKINEYYADLIRKHTRYLKEKVEKYNK